MHPTRTLRRSFAQRPILRTARTYVAAVTDDPASYWTLAVILAISFTFYIIFLNQTVHNVVQRQHLESSLSALTASVGQLQSEDIALENGVTLDRAHSLGFVDVPETHYLARTSGPEVAFRNE